MHEHADNGQPRQPPETAPANGSHERRVGDFVIRRELGRGGMGTVYEAWQSSLSRAVALKVLASHVSASPKAITRFRREAQAAAKLHHTNIVQVFAQGESDGIHYYAMEYIAGWGLNHVIADLRGARHADPVPPDLAETVALSTAEAGTAPASRGSERGGVPADSAVRLSAPSKTHAPAGFYNEVAEHAASVADALDYAHQCGVVHRDIKPHNLILGTDGRMRLSDFGLARLSEQPGVTVTGEMIGSPLYMAPEQIKGSLGEVDHRADIYSLGATLYEWLTLSPPYPGETRERVISRILSGEAPAPRTINPNVPIDLETIVLKSIERDPNRRYQRAGELRDDLRRFVASRPIVAKRAGPHTRLTRYVARHQLSTVLTLAVLVAGALFMSLRKTQLQAESQRAAAEQAREDAAIVQQDNEQLLTLLGLLQGGPAKLAEVAITGMEGFVNTAPDAAARAEKADGSVALPDAGTPAGIAQTVAEEYYLSVAPRDWPPEPNVGDEDAARLREAVLYWLDEQVAEARRVLAIYIERRADDFNALQLYVVLSCLSGRFDEMSRAANRMHLFPGRSADAAVWVGVSDLLLDRSSRAFKSLEQALQLDESRLLVRVFRGLGAIRRGQSALALGDFDAVLAADPESVPAMLGRASALLAFGQYEKAVPAATWVLARRSTGRVRAHALTIRGDCHAALGDHENAAQDYQQAIDIEGQTFSLLAKKAAAQVQMLSQRAIARRKRESEATGDEVPAGQTSENEGAQPVGPLFEYLNRRLRSSDSSGGGLRSALGPARRLGGGP